MPSWLFAVILDQFLEKNLNEIQNWKKFYFFIFLRSGEVIDNICLSKSDLQASRSNRSVNRSVEKSRFISYKIWLTKKLGCRSLLSSPIPPIKNPVTVSSSPIIVINFPPSIFSIFRYFFGSFHKLVQNSFEARVWLAKRPELPRDTIPSYFDREAFILL